MNDFVSQPLNPIPITRPPFQRFNSPRSNRILKILILVALLLFIAAILVFWFGGSSFTESGVELKLEGPEQALSGDEVTYTVVYENNTRTDLRKLNFRFRYPENSIVIKDDGSYSEDITEEFTIETLQAGKKETKEFRAFLVGDKGSVLTANTEMTYQAGGISSRFEKKPVIVSTTIVGMPVPVTLSAAPTAVSGQDITYTLDYRNDSQDDISDLRFSFKYPEGFTPKRYSPQPSTGSTVWNVPLLKKNSGNRISITGSLVGNERDNKTVTVTLQRKIQGTYINYERSEASTLISSPLMSVRLAVNGNRDYTASPGDQLTYSVTYRNTSTYNFSGLSLSVKLEGEMFDLGTIDPAGGFFDDATQSVVWNGSSAPGLSNLGPGISHTVQFRVRLKSSFGGGGLGSKNFFVKTTGTLITLDVPTGLDGDSVSSQDSLVTKITTQPTVVQTMYYSDAAFGATGSMPPVVGQETVFTIHWQITNPGNAVNNTILRANLPTGVNWKNVTSNASNLPAPTFDTNKRQVIWNLGTVPAGVGVNSAKYDIAFQIGITPSSAQRNSTPILLRDVSFTGVDSFTQENILINLDELSTGDTLDRSGQGTVQ
jgi:hypothetical protein